MRHLKARSFSNGAPTPACPVLYCSLAGAAPIPRAPLGGGYPLELPRAKSRPGAAVERVGQSGRQLASGTGRAPRSPGGARAAARGSAGSESSARGAGGAFSVLTRQQQLRGLRLMGAPAAAAAALFAAGTPPGTAPPAQAANLHAGPLAPRPATAPGLVQGSRREAAQGRRPWTAEGSSGGSGSGPFGAEAALGHRQRAPSLRLPNNM